MLFLIPAYISENSPIDYFAPAIKEYILKTDYFFVENEKTARKIIKFFAPEKKQSDLKLFLLDKNTERKDLQDAQMLMVKGQDFGLLSEAGLPCIADPGNLMVKLIKQIRKRKLNGWIIRFKLLGIHRFSWKRRIAIINCLMIYVRFFRRKQNCVLLPILMIRKMNLSEH